MVLAVPGPLLTPPDLAKRDLNPWITARVMTISGRVRRGGQARPSSSPPKTPHRSYSAQIRSQNEEKNPLPQTVPAPTDENLTYTFAQTPSNVQSRRAPALKNTCHVRFAPHVGATTVGAEERGGRGTTSSRTTTGGAPELSPPKSACAGDAVLRTSPRGTVPIGQYAGCHRGQHLTMHISTNDLHC